MTLLKSTLLATAAAAMLAGQALAGDPIDYPPLPTEYVETGFDWDGFYAGVGLGGTSIAVDSGTDNLAQLDAIVGVNITHDSFLFGAELFLGASRDIASGTYGGHGGIEARAGYLIDQDILIYAGLGRIHYESGAQYTTVGVGTEFAVSDDISIDLEYKYLGWSDTGYTGHNFSASALWHF
ncbi:outer membrane immunogenic protein [Maritalea mobilis]|uniref:Outer membrane immunogenic protein n=1 Tax=Maritalea mobilis TaxID=483324 RepID=A0A4R6VJW8_9HYPH|nr:outer membrane beta-barrel protein [Maritalea mobilis]TDQ63695.1 outer membrane immunogenic protein [Maritalea mobilis]